MIDKPAADLRTVVQSPAFRRKVQEQGAMSDDLDPKQFGQGLNAELAGWPQVVRSSKIEAE